MSPVTFEYRVAKDGFGRYHVEVYYDPDGFLPETFHGRTCVYQRCWTTLKTTWFKSRAIRIMDTYRHRRTRDAILNAAAMQRTVIHEPPHHPR